MNKQPTNDSSNIEHNHQPCDILPVKTFHNATTEEASLEDGAKKGAFRLLKTNFYKMIDLTTKMTDYLNKQTKFSNYDLKNMAVSLGVIYDKIKDYELQEGKIKSLKKYEDLIGEYNGILSDIKGLVKDKVSKSGNPNKIRENFNTSHNTNYVNLPPGSICPTPVSPSVDPSLTAKKIKVQKVVEEVELKEDELI